MLSPVRGGLLDDLVDARGDLVGHGHHQLVAVLQDGGRRRQLGLAEADQPRGREIRKQEEERGKQLRLAEERCRKGRALPTDNCAAVRQR